MTAMMEEILIEPTEEWLPEAAAYKRAFEAAGDSMDGTGGLRTGEAAGGLYGHRHFRAVPLPHGL